MKNTHETLNLVGLSLCSGYEVWHSPFAKSSDHLAIVWIDNPKSDRKQYYWRGTPGLGIES